MLGTDHFISEGVWGGGVGHLQKKKKEEKERQLQVKSAKRKQSSKLWIPWNPWKQIKTIRAAYEIEKQTLVLS